MKSWLDTGRRSILSWAFLFSRRISFRMTRQNRWLSISNFFQKMRAVKWDIFGCTKRGTTFGFYFFQILGIWCLEPKRGNFISEAWLFKNSKAPEIQTLSPFQRLRLATQGWSLLDFNANLWWQHELEHQGEQFLQPVTKKIILWRFDWWCYVLDTPNLLVPAEAFSSEQLLQLQEIYEPFEPLWAWTCFCSKTQCRC